MEVSIRAEGGRREVLAEVLKRTAPIVLGFLPVGFAYGVLARKAGLPDWATLLMSLAVYAGSSQLVAVGMFGAGAGPAAIIAATFIVNLRHLLMSAALSPHFRGWPKVQVAAAMFELTDETFAVHSARFAEGRTSKAETFGINVMAQASWVCGSWLGLSAGGVIPDVRQFGLDYALPAMFIALLAGQLVSRVRVMVAALSAVAAVILYQAGFGHWGVVLATVLGAAFGAGVESWTSK